jgi:hypothetical protein
LNIYFCPEMSSYVLDRELLLASARNNANNSNWIDVNSNASLLGTTVYQRNSDSEIRKQMADVILFNKCNLKIKYSKNYLSFKIN